MGQYWQIILPHDRAVFESIGKLGESLFDGSPSSIVDYLAIPVTEWIDNTCNDQAFLKKKNSIGASSTSSSPFLSLPPEVHSMIFSHLSLYADIFCLALVNLHLWHIGRQELKQFIRSNLSHLAHTPLICVGDEHTTTPPLDYPATLLTRSEEDELLAGLDSDEYEDEAVGESQSHKPVNLYTLAEARYYRINTTSIWQSHEIRFQIVDERWRSLREIARTSQHNFPEPERSQVLALASPKFEQFFPGGGTEWVLRNLTTREFVRAESIALRPELVRGPNIRKLGFGEVVLARICWSSYDNTGIGGDRSLHRGVWAGHCLDIVTAERLQMDKGEGGDEWRDIGEEVKEEVREIWKSEYGIEGWVEKLLESGDVW